MTLPAVIRRPVLGLVLVAALAAGPAAGCGEEEELEVVEGEPLELGELSYNVQLTRLLNPNDPEDSAYLRGQEVPAPPGEEFLAVFLTIENEGESEATVPEDFLVVDTRGNDYEPLHSDTPFALRLGAELAPGGELPAADTPAASGPTKGAVMVFLVDEFVSENRPLELEVPGPAGETGIVELDI